ncbi:histidine kinase [Mucilaginibacter sp. BJC16-A38]|uniref:sensor histidine kinase n=1 Tax=Mucilaginibacter phenanthrenivorans TaxID=1234842 RepID=UPI0021588587|nr:histidine kinase [Mucilaginibacter phenanthrenivorans]MCR8560019.1 histidine kinase [Mucilaginibacter phenanthrenivorans]
MLKRLKPALLLEVLLHLLFWAFITFLPILTGPSDPVFRSFFSPWHLALINLLLAIQFYLNAFFLIPVFLNKRKQPWLYFTLLLAAFICLDFLIMRTHSIMRFPPGMHPFGRAMRPPFANFNLLPLTAITAAGFAYRYLADRFRQINTKQDITNAALVSELAFLRSQISPHFIFNVINSVVALSRLKPAAVEPTLIQLSQLLRYMLYITDEEKVTMKQKADYLSNYIQLQKLRFGEQVKVDFTTNINAPEKTIEPMLLIPFVENAFKHGTGDILSPEIKVYLTANQKTLNLQVSNTFNPDEEQKDEHHGIGLNNVRRRLALLYPGKYSLVTSHSNNNYHVNLQIQLK